MAAGTSKSLLFINTTSAASMAISVPAPIAIPMSAHYDQYEGKVQDAAQKVNDTYLKAFSEESGVQSYG